MKQLIIAFVFTLVSLVGSAQTITILDTLIGIDTLAATIDVQGATPGDSLYIELSGSTNAAMLPVALFSGDTTISFGFGGLTALKSYDYVVIIAENKQATNLSYAWLPLTTLPDTLNPQGTLNLALLEYATVDTNGDSTWHTEVSALVDANVPLTLEVSRSDNYGVWNQRFCSVCENPYVYRNSHIGFEVENVANPTRFAVTAWWNTTFIATDTIEFYPRDTTSSDTTGIILRGNEFDPIHVYPNPANDIIMVKDVPYSSGVTIYDMYGQEVLATTTEENSPIKVSELLPGLYILVVEDDNGQPKQYARFMKE